MTMQTLYTYSDAIFAIQFANAWDISLSILDRLSLEAAAARLARHVAIGSTLTIRSL